MQGASGAGHSLTPAQLTVAGRGNLGRSLARAFRAAGHPARLVPSRSGLRLPQAGLVFLAVPDGAVAGIAARIAAMEPGPGLSFVHVSGALPLTALDALSGHAVGSFHPLQSFPVPRDPSAFRGISIAVAVLEAAGWSRADAQRSLQPLVEGVVANLRKRGVVKALTGPVRRGDVETVNAHRRALARLDGDPKIEAVYRMLGLVALGIATEAGLDHAAAWRTRRALTRDVAATRRSSRR
jgi:predicted short-subunit dehydrogenase-like oxidoreductase (DUF2520 family)